MNASELSVEVSPAGNPNTGRPAMVHILAPRKKAFGCGVCDHNDVVVQRLRAAGVLVHTTHFGDAGFSAPKDIRKGDVVFLQLSVYGFAKRGAPLWLPGLLARLRKNGAHVVTFFHELWVRWPRFTSSAFWLAPFQHLICGQVLALSDTAIFNVEWGYDWARRHGRSDVRYIRTFSNVGEPDLLPDWKARHDNMVVFGNAGARADIYRALLAAAPGHGARVPMGLIDIGQHSPILNPYLADGGAVAAMFREVQRLGPLPVDAISRLLAGNKFGLFAAPWEHAGKSSVLAGYVAHGMCPVSIHARPHAPTRAKLPPKPSVHYALLPQMDLQTANGSPVYAAIAQTARYHYHSSHDIVALLRNALGLRASKEAGRS